MRVQSLFVLFAVVFSVSALAARPSYNYLGAAYTYQDLDWCTQDGFNLEGSIVYDEQFFIQGQFSDVDGDICGSTNVSLSAGVRSNLGSASSLYGKITLLSRDTGSDSDPGIGITMGARSFVARGVEAEAFIGYEKVDNYSEAFVGAAGSYWLNRDVAFRATLVLIEEDKQAVSFGVRLQY